MRSLCLAIGLLASPGMALADGPTKSACYAAAGVPVELEFVIKEPAAPILYVTFIGKKPSPTVQGEVVKRCLIAASRLDPDRDMMGSAQFKQSRSVRDLDSQDLKPFGEDKMIIYRAASKGVAIESFDELLKKLR